MKYSFEIIGVSSFLYFFNHQQQKLQKPKPKGVEYLGAYKCTLDAFLESLETIPGKYGWELDQVVDTVVQFWLNNSDNIRYWQERLSDAGSNNLIVARVADIKSLKAEFESILGEG